MTATTLDAANATSADWVTALRGCQDRLAALAADLDEPTLRAQSYDTEWSIAQVLSHLGSQAQIFAMYLQSGLEGTDVPGTDVLPPIWDAWNAKSPTEARSDALAANEELVARIESLPPTTVDAFQLTLFGLDLDLAGYVRLRLAELAVHTWDVAVALDPEATVEAGPVALLIDGLEMVARWSGRPGPEPYKVRIDTHDPARAFLVTVADAVQLEPATEGVTTDGQVGLSAEAFLRLVYGRLDAGHSPTVTESGTRGLADLRTVFPGV